MLDYEDIVCCIAQIQSRADSIIYKNGLQAEATTIFFSPSSCVRFVWTGSMGKGGGETYPTVYIDVSICRIYRIITFYYA